MKKFTYQTCILLLVFLFPSLALSEEVTIGIEGISSLTQVAQLTGAPPAMVLRKEGVV